MSTPTYTLERIVLPLQGSIVRGVHALRLAGRATAMRALGPDWQWSCRDPVRVDDRDGAWNDLDTTVVAYVCHRRGPTGLVPIGTALVVESVLDSAPEMCVIDVGVNATARLLHDQRIPRLAWKRCRHPDAFHGPGSWDVRYLRRQTLPSVAEYWTARLLNRQGGNYATVLAFDHTDFSGRRVLAAVAVNTDVLLAMAGLTSDIPTTNGVIRYVIGELIPATLTLRPDDRPIRVLQLKASWRPAHNDPDVARARRLIADDCATLAIEKPDRLATQLVPRLLNLGRGGRLTCRAWTVDDTLMATLNIRADQGAVRLQPIVYESMVGRLELGLHQWPAGLPFGRAWETPAVVDDFLEHAGRCVNAFWSARVDPDLATNKPQPPILAAEAENLAWRAMVDHQRAFCLRQPQFAASTTVRTKMTVLVLLYRERHPVASLAVGTRDLEDKTRPDRTVLAVHLGMEPVVFERLAATMPLPRARAIGAALLNALLMMASKATGHRLRLRVDTKGGTAAFYSCALGIDIDVDRDRNVARLPVSYAYRSGSKPQLAKQRSESGVICTQIWALGQATAVPNAEQYGTLSAINVKRRKSSVAPVFMPMPELKLVPSPSTSA